MRRHYRIGAETSDGAKWLTDRYDVARLRLRPNFGEDAQLIAVVRTVVPDGSVYHVLDHVLEQYEDVYVILVDDRTVVSFELPRGKAASSAAGVRVWRLADYREYIGQGRSRIWLDRTVEAVKLEFAAGTQHSTG